MHTYNIYVSFLGEFVFSLCNTVIPPKRKQTSVRQGRSKKSKVRGAGIEDYMYIL